MTDTRPTPRSLIQPDLGSNRILLTAGILLTHFLLLGLLFLLPKDEQKDAQPLPMVMVDLQPAIPLAVGAHHNSTQQAVTAQEPTAALTREVVEVASPVAAPQQSVARKNTASVAMAKPASSATPLSPMPTQTVSSTAASEHAITTQAVTTSGANDSSARTGTQIASTSGTSGAHSASLSPPQFGAGYLSNPAPDYPELAREMGEEGKVLLHVLVTPEGHAKKVKLHRTSGSDSLDEAAVKAVRKWRFVPAKLGEQAVEAWVFVPIVFKLD